MLSEKSWKPEAVVRLLFSVLICIFASALALNGAERLGGVRFEDSPWRAVVAALSFQGVILVFVHFFVREHQMRWADAFGFHNGWKRAVLIGVLAMLFFLPIGWGLQWTTVELMTRLNFEPDEQQALQALRLTKGWMDGTALAVVAIVLAPLAEEFLFRGILYTTVKQLGFPRLALWGTSLLFAAIHWNLPTFLPLLVLALMLASLYEKTGNLLAPIAAHSLFNALNFSLFYFGDRFEWLVPHQQ